MLGGAGGVWARVVVAIMEQHTWRPEAQIADIAHRFADTHQPSGTHATALLFFWDFKRLAIPQLAESTSIRNAVAQADAMESHGRDRIRRRQSTSHLNQNMPFAFRFSLNP